MRTNSIPKLLISTLVMGFLLPISLGSSASATPTSYAVGDTGPGGGKIFLLPNSAGNSTGKYFEASNTPAYSSLLCHTATTTVNGASGIGTGAANTVALQGDSNCMTDVDQSNNPADAAKFLSTYTSGGLSDWFLPSFGEMKALYLSQAVTISDSVYWVSTTHSNGTSYDGGSFVTAYPNSLSYTSAHGGIFPFFAVRSFNPGAPAFTLSTSSETATVGQALTAGYAINSTGDIVTSYSISSQPGHGLSFSTTTGFITGTPTSSMTSTTFTITGTNAAGSATATITLTILPAQVPIVIAPANSQQISGTVGTAFSFNFNISGGVTPYTVAISSGTLPAGLSMTTGGQISGTPTAAGNATLSFTVEDAISTQASAVTGVVFAISAASAPAPARVEVPAPTQQSKIVKISPETGTALETTSVVASGTFIEKITSIQVNGVPLPAGSWKETTTAITFVVPVLAAGKYSIQIYNGSAPLLAAQSFVVPGSVALVANPLKRTSIVCTIGKHSRTFFGLKPVCPAGYTKK